MYYNDIISHNVLLSKSMLLGRRTILLLYKQMEEVVCGVALNRSQVGGGGASLQCVSVVRTMWNTR